MKEIRIQSNGIGQQSWALYFMSCLGLLPRFDYSIFADPGSEDQRSYEYLAYAMEWAKANNGIPLLRVAERDLYTDLMAGLNSREKRFVSIPAFIKNEDGSTGMILRQCTGEYKIAQFNKAVRMVLGIGNQNFPRVEVYNAITIEEVDRVTLPEIAKFINVYPFCNMAFSKASQSFLQYKTMTRADCVRWLQRNGFRVPVKSSCTFCPYQSDARWLERRQRDPDEWARIVKLDRAIRNGAGSIRQPIYLHRSLKPIDQVYLREDQTKIFENCSDACDV